MAFSAIGKMPPNAYVPLDNIIPFILTPKPIVTIKQFVAPSTSAAIPTAELLPINFAT